MRRSFALGTQRAREKSGGDLIIEIAFASEEPYERWFGIEILDCSEGSVRLDRLNDGAPILFNHRWDDLRGTHEPGTVHCDPDKVLRGKARIESVTQLGRDTIGLIESGILAKASVGYRVHKVIEQTTTKDGRRIERELPGDLFERELERCGGDERRGDRAAFRRALDAAVGRIDRASEDDDETVYRVMDWEPFENSLVTIPADNTVGIGRSLASQPAAPAAASRERATMPDDNKAAAGAIADPEVRQQSATPSTHPAQPAQTPSAMEMETARKRGIHALAQANKIEDKVRDYWIGAGLSLDQVADDILAIIKARSEETKTHPAHLGLSSKEQREFSIARMIHACASNDWSQAGFEVECSRELAKRMNKTPSPTRFLVPLDVQMRAVEIQRRDLTVATAGAGGYLVGTTNVGFIDMLRNRAVAFRMGATRLTGLRESVTVPRQSAAATAYWLANEATAITESQQTFVQMALTPKNVGAYTEISRQLLLQSNPAAEAIVTADLAAQVALAVDLAALEGSGASGQPTGIANTSGIGAVTGTSIDYAKVLEFQTDVADANVMPVRGGYVTTPAVAALLKQRVKFASTASPLWEGNIWDGTMEGFPAMSSKQLTAATMIFGDWTMLVVGEWGTLEIDVNPYADFKAALVGVRAIYTVDVGVRIPAAFSRATSIT